MCVTTGKGHHQDHQERQRWARHRQLQGSVRVRRTREPCERLTGLAMALPGGWLTGDGCEVGRGGVCTAACSQRAGVRVCCVCACPVLGGSYANCTRCRQHTTYIVKSRLVRRRMGRHLKTATPPHRSCRCHAELRWLAGWQLFTVVGAAHGAAGLNAQYNHVYVDKCFHSSMITLAWQFACSVERTRCVACRATSTTL